MDFQWCLSARINRVSIEQCRISDLKNTEMGESNALKEKSEKGIFW